MLKLDLNLNKARHELVPEMISEDDFWRNYFYRIECLKKDLDLPNRLGSKIPVAQREKSLRQKSAQLADGDEEEALQESTSTLR